MAGLVPAIHVLAHETRLGLIKKEDVDARTRPGMREFNAGSHLPCAIEFYENA
jgi:hypothetical protein